MGLKLYKNLSLWQRLNSFFVLFLILTSGKEKFENKFDLDGSKFSRILLSPMIPYDSIIENICCLDYCQLETKYQLFDILNNNDRNREFNKGFRYSWNT